MAGTLMRALRGDDQGPSHTEDSYQVSTQELRFGQDISAPSYRRAKAKSSAELPTTVVRSLEDCWVPRNEAGATHDDPDELATLPPRSQEGSPDLAGFSDDVLDEEAPDYADPLETVDSFRPQSENPILDECKLDNFKVATINSWISSKVGKERMNQVRTAADELSAAMSRLSPGSRPALDAIAVSWGLPVSTAARLERNPLAC